MEFETRAKTAIRSIPRGKVATYALIAAVAGNHRGARQVARVLHSSSGKDKLPWHRVINSRGGLSLPKGRGFEEQRRRLIADGVRVSKSGQVDLSEFLWEPAGGGTREALRFLRRLTASGGSGGRKSSCPEIKGRNKGPGAKDAISGPRVRGKGEGRTEKGT
jgi:methylated-DNA-protein-cysteine methyltransferase-like protein